MVGSPEELHSYCRVTPASILIIFESRAFASFVDDGDDAVSLGLRKVNFIIMININDGVDHNDYSFRYGDVVMVLVISAAFCNRVPDLWMGSGLKTHAVDS